MKSKIIRQITIAISALLIMNSAAISAEAILFKIFNDPEMKNPRADEPFLIFLDGHLTDKGITNEKGQIITKNRNPGEMQQFVMKILGFGTYTVTFNLEKNKQKPLVRRISREYEFAPTWTYQCMTKPTGAQVAHTGYNYSEPLEISK